MGSLNHIMGGTEHSHCIHISPKHTHSQCLHIFKTCTIAHVYTHILRTYAHQHTTPTSNKCTLQWYMKTRARGTVLWPQAQLPQHPRPLTTSTALATARGIVWCAATTKSTNHSESHYWQYIFKTELINERHPELAINS